MILKGPEVMLFDVLSSREWRKKDTESEKIAQHLAAPKFDDYCKRHKSGWQLAIIVSHWTGMCERTWCLRPIEDNTDAALRRTIEDNGMLSHDTCYQSD